MEKRKHIFCRINLSLFLLSFLLLIAGSLLVNSGSHALDLKHTQLVSKQGVMEEGTQQLSENNETENESDESFELLEFVLPYFVTGPVQAISYLYPQESGIQRVNTVNPIYVTVHNFRI